MKILSFLLVFYSTTTTAQITIQPQKPAGLIGTVSTGTYEGLKLMYIVNDKDTVYILTIKDEGVKDRLEYKAVQFREEGGTLQQLYNLIIKRFDQKDEGEVRFKLGIDEVTLAKSKLMGTKFLYLRFKGGFTSFTLKQAKALFGKD